MRKFASIVFTVALLLFLVAMCSGGSDEPETAAPQEPTVSDSPTPTQTETGPELPEVDVPWDNYAPSVRTRINSLIVDKKCGGLQREFDNADLNGSLEIMEYVDEGLRIANCY